MPARPCSVTPRKTCRCAAARTASIAIWIPPPVPFLKPTGIERPEASSRWTWLSVVRAPIAPQATTSEMYCGVIGSTNSVAAGTPSSTRSTRSFRATRRPSLTAKEPSRCGSSVSGSSSRRIAGATRGRMASTCRSRVRIPRMLDSGARAAGTEVSARRAGGADTLGRERQLPHTRAARREHGIRDGGRGRHGARLADAGRRRGRVAGDVDVDRFRRVAEGRDRIRVPAARDDATVAVLDLLQQGPRRGLLDAALDLVAHAVGVEREARVDGGPHVDQTHLARRRDLDLHDLRDVGPVVDRPGDPEAATLVRAPPPAAPLRDALVDLPEARIPDVAKAERQRLLLRGERELVHERLDAE